MLVAKMTSMESYDKMLAAVNARFSGGVNTNIDPVYDKVLTNSTYAAIGSGGTSGPNTIGYADILAYLEAGKTFSMEVPLMPISYKVNYLLDNSLVSDGASTEFTYHDCEGRLQEIELYLSHFQFDDCYFQHMDPPTGFEFEINVMVNDKLYKSFSGLNEYVNLDERIILPSRDSGCLKLRIKYTHYTARGYSSSQLSGQEICYPWNELWTDYKIVLPNNRGETLCGRFNYSMRKL